MTAPTNPADATPEVRDANQEANTTNAKSDARNGDRYVVKCPWSTSVFKSRDNSFPDVTPEGTEMSADERDAAKAAANSMWLRLSSKKVGDN